MDIKIIKQQVNKASIILIGIGTNLYKSKKIEDDIESWNSIKEYINSNIEVNKLNSKILDLVKNKEYFILTTSWNSNLNETFPKERLFTPGGNCFKLQCYNACTSQLWDAETLLESNEQPLCPYCQKKLIMNIKTDAYFVREPYNIQEKNYHSWIHNNYNENILLIELETSNKREDDIKIIRESFENITAVLPNASLLRINSRESLIPEVIKDRTVSIEINLNDLIEGLITC